MIRKVNQLWQHQHWGIGLVRNPIGCFLDPAFNPDIEWFSAPTFAADPFPVTHNGRTAVLYEEFDYRSHRGRISAVEIEDAGFTRVYRNVIEDEHHFSYPFCLHVDNELYCIPEHHESNRLAAWRCLRFPDRWVPDRVLLDGVPIVDPTIFHDDEFWWLGCARQDRGPNSRFWLYFSDSPLGPWHEHSAQPVREGSCGTRPAGPVFEHAGHRYRPTQDCSKAYGGAIVLQRIEVLNRREYREVSVGRIEGFAASPYPRGTHHIAGAGDLTLIDGCRHVYSPHETAFVLRRWGRRLLGI